jgi:hypothetical protein
MKDLSRLKIFRHPKRFLQPYYVQRFSTIPLFLCNDYTDLEKNERVQNLLKKLERNLIDYFSSIKKKQMK